MPRSLTLPFLFPFLTRRDVAISTTGRNLVHVYLSNSILLTNILVFLHPFAKIHPKLSKIHPFYTRITYILFKIVIKTSIILFYFNTYVISFPTKIMDMFSIDMYSIVLMYLPLVVKL